MKSFVFLGIVVATLCASFGLELPSFLHVCSRNDPNLGQCIINSVYNFMPYLKNGLPDYKIPSLEPLLLKELTSTSGGNIKLKLSNVNVYGASDVILKRINANMQKLRFIIDLDLPKLRIEGGYNIDGQLILLRIRGDGPVNGNFTNCKASVKLQLEKTKGADGDTYLKVSTLQTKIAVGGGKLRLQNLFGGDPALGEAVNGAINSNFDSFIQELTPALESAISSTFTQIADSVLSQFSYDTLFPDA
ncbi:circadian clock-controlled protein [Ceratina calcarata]|uniref:Circadian clock-controlled protein n=2 Tax=Ceratina calcarata TaxID=156304 RepID=A0AAJ7JGF6_9HYME|nr:circadian clock-controlled protein [Ceratina calcarata]